ncbi:MAG: GNAT family N-acetyltransferase [Chthoniobacteraceae bacterium]
MTDSPAFECTTGHVRLLPQAECRALPLWTDAFCGLAKDHRYHEIVDDTLGDDFDCRVLVVHDQAGTPVALQPCFFVEQDLMATAPAFVCSAVARLRGVWPRLLRLRMLMIGCAAGEGHPSAPAHRPALIETLPAIARRYGAALVVWKDIPSAHRSTMTALDSRFTRVPSMPSTRLALGYGSFDDYLARALGHSMRKNLRRKFRALAAAPPIEMTVATSIASVVDEAHALYLQVFARSALRFEKLTREFLLELERRMPDRVRFFLWRQQGRLVAFSLCFVHDGELYDEYLGLDYRVALDLHLYFVTFRDVLSWALAQGLRAYHSTPLNYDPKLHLGFHLAPLDLYVAPAADWARSLVRLVLPWIQPTRAEPILREFPNADQL